MTVANSGNSRTRRANGEGSIAKAPDGRWHGFLDFGTKAGGKRDRRHVSGKTRREVADKLRALQAKRDAGVVPTDGASLTVGAWLVFWLDNIAAHSVRPSTLGSYRNYVHNRLVPQLGHHRLDRLQPEHVEAFFRAVTVPSTHIDPATGRTIELGPLAAASTLQAHRILSRALKVAMRRGRVGRNVCELVDPPRVTREPVEPLTLAEARAVLTASSTLRNASRWSVALSIGLRQGEALGLTWDCVDLDGATLRVDRALQRVAGAGLTLVEPKSRAGRRTVVLPDDLVNALREHRRAQVTERLAAGSEWHEGPHGGYVFAQPNGKPIDARADWKTWKALLASAGVRDARLHDARHTAATLLFAQGVQARTIQQILGHSQIALTMNTYTKVVDELERDAARRMGAALFGASAPDLPLNGYQAGTADSRS